MLRYRKGGENVDINKNGYLSNDPPYSLFILKSDSLKARASDN